MKVCPNCSRQYPDDANFCPADAGRLEPDAGTTQRGLAPVGASSAIPASPPDASGAAIGGRFDLVTRLGGGHTGEVYEARDRESWQPCVVKLVDPAVFPNPVLLQRAERELKQLERLNLPEVARVFAHGRQGERLWIALELVSGAQLTRLVLEGGPLPPLLACRVVRQVAHGLAEAAKQGVIHHDLAPKNVLVGDGEKVKIINFPIPVPFSDRVQGVPEFLAPEQVEGKPADQRSSIYSLGALFYFAVTGRPPFVGDAADVYRAHLSREVVRPSRVASVPESIEAVIMKAMEKASPRRFMTLHQMMGELDSILAGALAGADLAHRPVAQGKARDQAQPAETLVGVAGSPVQPGAQAAPPPAASAPVMPDANPPMTMAQAEAVGRTPAVFVSTPPAGAPALMASPGSDRLKKPRKSNKGSALSSKFKGKFRETMWFKKGELDEVAAAAAASAHKGELVSDRADALPIEDRYRDDGTLDRQDAERLSLHTGSTALKMKAMRAAPLPRKRVSETYLMREMRRSRMWLFLFLLLVIGAIAGVVYYFQR